MIVYLFYPLNTIYYEKFATTKHLNEIRFHRYPFGYLRTKFRVFISYRSFSANWCRGSWRIPSFPIPFLAFSRNRHGRYPYHSIKIYRQKPSGKRRTWQTAKYRRGRLPLSFYHSPYPPYPFPFCRQTHFSLFGQSLYPRLSYFNFRACLLLPIRRNPRSVLGG